MIRFNDVSASYEEQQTEIDAALAAVVRQGDFVGGRAIGEFEAAFADYTGAAACAGMSSGTAALHLALLAAGVKPDDEVITTPMTFIATSEAISLCGARPIFADVAPDTINLDPVQVQATITEKTRAILFVHLHGNPGGAVEVAEVAKSNGLLFFEDCAQAHGALLTGGRHVGCMGAAAAYSFFPAKNLGAFGDAGAVTSNDAELANRARRLANHGRSEKYLHAMEGTNARMDTLQAAVLKVKLALLETQVKKRNLLAQRYMDGLAGLPLQFQPPPAGCRHAWHLFTVRTNRRDELQKFLTAHEIETGIHYPVPLHLQPAYAGMGLELGSFPAAEQTAQETLSLPMYPQLAMESVDVVVAALRKFFVGE